MAAADAALVFVPVWHYAGLPKTEKICTNRAENPTEKQQSHYLKIYTMSCCEQNGSPAVSGANSSVTKMTDCCKAKMAPFKLLIPPYGPYFNTKKEQVNVPLKRNN